AEFLREGLDAASGGGVVALELGVARLQLREFCGTTGGSRVFAFEFGDAAGGRRVVALELGVVSLQLGMSGLRLRGGEAFARLRGQRLARPGTRRRRLVGLRHRWALGRPSRRLFAFRARYTRSFDADAAHHGVEIDIGLVRHAGSVPGLAAVSGSMTFGSLS